MRKTAGALVHFREIQADLFKWSLILCLLTGCAKEEALPELSDHAIGQVQVFTARNVITMDASNTMASAVAVADGQILAVGSVESIEQALPDKKLVIDARFADKVLMPGFIDNHLHPALAGVLLPARFITPFAWDLPNQKVQGVQGRDAYLAKLVELEASLSDDDEMLITWGYHQYFHGEITRSDINEISSSRPIIVWQRSFHEVVLNDAALEALAITADEFADHPAINFANGHFWESGLIVISAKLMPVVLEPQRFRSGMRVGLQHAVANGITTLCDQGVPMFNLDMEMSHLDALIREEELPLRMLIIGSAKTLGLAGNEVALEIIETMPARNTDALTFLPKQVKLLADGAMYSQLMQMEDGYLDGHEGEWLMTPAELMDAARLYWNADYQLHIHVNGDKGLRVVLDTIEQLLEEYPRDDHRTVLHHLGYSKAGQIDRIAELGVSVSANPFYLWALGDKYSEIGVGPERSHYITRLGALERNNVSISLHSDLPMAPAAPLTLAANAASRLTAENSLLAPDERISVETALRGITIEAAWAIQQQDSIGSIEAGKQADFTVLEQDPYRVLPEQLGDIPIWGTVLGGRPYPKHAATLSH